MLFNVMTHT